MPAATKTVTTKPTTAQTQTAQTQTAQTRTARTAKTTRASARTKSADTTPDAGARAHPPPLPPSSPHLRSPASRSARDQFEQAVHELAEAATSTHLYDQYCGAHMAALHAAAAVVTSRTVPAPPGRRRPRSVWDLLYRAAPDLADWAAYFASGATRRAAAEAGLPNAVTPQEAADLVREAEVFLGVVAGVLGVPYQYGLPYAEIEEQAS